MSYYMLPSWNYFVLANSYELLMLKIIGYFFFEIYICFLEAPCAQEPLKKLPDAGRIFFLSRAKLCRICVTHPVCTNQEYTGYT